MKCNNCGAVLVKTAVFCDECGVKIDPLNKLKKKYGKYEKEFDLGVKEPPKMNAGHGIVILVGLLFGIIPGIILYFFISRDISRKRAEWQRQQIINKI